MELAAHVPGRFVAATLRNVILFYWLDDGRVEDVQLLDGLCERLQKSHGMLSAVHLVKEGVGLPTAPVRKALASSMDRFADASACIAVVMLGAGFWASALQSAITGIRMMSATRDSQLRFMRDTEALKGWFVGEHERISGTRVDELLLLISLEQVKSMGDRSTAEAASR